MVKYAQYFSVFLIMMILSTNVINVVSSSPYYLRKDVNFTEQQIQQDYEMVKHPNELA